MQNKMYILRYTYNITIGYNNNLHYALWEFIGTTKDTMVLPCYI